MTTLQDVTQAVAGHIQKPYTEQEIAEQIKSGCYDAELMLQHLLRLYNGTSAALERWESEIGKVMPTDCKDYWQNDPAERPMVTRLLIESLRERERMAWECACWIRTWEAEASPSPRTMPESISRPAKLTPITSTQQRPALPAKRHRLSFLSINNEILEAKESLETEN